MNVMPSLGLAIGNIDSGLSAPGIFGAGGYYNQRLPADPIFFTTIVLQNIVVGSRYWVARASDLTLVLAAGVAGTAEVSLENVPSYSNPMLVEVRVRTASTEPKYQPFKTYGYLVRGGINIYCAQTPDPVA